MLPYKSRSKSCCPMQTQIEDNRGVRDDGHRLRRGTKGFQILRPALFVIGGDSAGDEHLIKGMAIQAGHARCHTARDMACRVGTTREIEQDFRLAHFSERRIIRKSNRHEERLREWSGFCKGRCAVDLNDLQAGPMPQRCGFCLRK
jgi:hypothetical protein